MWRTNFYTLSASIVLSALTFHFSDLAYATDCTTQWTPIAPYFTSSVTGVSTETFVYTAKKLRTVYGKSEHITTENFRDLNKIPKQRISRNTLVRPYMGYYKSTADFSRAESMFGQILNSERILNTYMPVQVVTPENIYVRLKSARDQALFVKPGDRGFIISESLEALDEAMALMADKDIELQEGTIIPRGSILTPVMKSEKNQRLFESTVCAQQEKTLYSFVIENTGNSQYMQIVTLNPQVDGAYLSPINLDHLANAVLVQKATNLFYNLDLNLADIELDYRGFVRLPMKNEEENSNISGYALDDSFVHYQGAYDPIYSDTWAKANTICGVMKLAQEWKKNCKGAGCTLQIGDLAFATGASNYSNRRKDPLGHVGHDEGQCVDIRPIRKDNILEKLTIYDPKKYDREKTKQFISFAKNKLQVDNVISSDGRVSGVKHLRGHADHVHMCFPETVNYCSMQ